MSKLSLQIIGHLGNDATIENVNGKQVIKFSVAHSEKYKNAQDVQVDKTTWVRCNYWNEKSNIAQYLKKGGLVEVTGQPSANAYLDKNNQPQASLDIRVTGISLLGSAPPQQNGQQQAPTTSTATTPTQNAPQQDENQYIPF